MCERRGIQIGLKVKSKPKIRSNNENECQVHKKTNFKSENITLLYGVYNLCHYEL
jgi:hypothetical protein